MWQRIQTLYMALGAVMFFFVGYNNLSNAQSLLAGLGVALLLANITYYKHRKRQFMVNRVVVIVAFVLEGWLIYGSMGLVEEATTVSGFLPLAAPLLAVIFTAMANRAIQADEKKVQSADRFRK
jgi:4-hydroxybenzoate polyprenyltransferase